MIGLHSSSTIDPQKHIVVESTKLIRKKLKTGPSTVEVVPDDEDCRKKALEALSEFACLQLTRQECLPSIDKVCRMATNASMAAMLNEQKTLHGNLTGCLEILSRELVVLDNVRQRAEVIVGELRKSAGLKYKELQLSLTDLHAQIITSLRTTVTRVNNATGELSGPVKDILKRIILSMPDKVRVPTSRCDVSEYSSFIAVLINQATSMTKNLFNVIQSQLHQ